MIRRAPLLAACLLACGPGKDTTDSDAGTGTGTGPGTGTGDATDGATSQPTSTEPPGTTGAPAGCAAADEAACATATPANPEHFCMWVDVYTASIQGTLCRTSLTRSTCMETDGIEGGPGCSGFFQGGADDSAELLTDLGCGNPLSEDGWEFCFQDGVTPATPACACIGESYCADQPDAQACMMASHDLRACAWQQGACGPA